ncbi:hypothetical protein F53441_4829 [Fusarium austroafricanum]|uniref:Peptidase M6-like domain-containing protein n=1 Tax=Fusarium austroafricanum TaxID=2364996 RepID=A0A8H4P1B3_9HYPO|nr:hypothetical protein F53441_4829 [Fusarium austroafricanum]
MLALSTLLLSSVWHAATAVGHVIQRDFDDSQLAGNDTGNWTEPVRGDYIWTPTCKLPTQKEYPYGMSYNLHDGCPSATGTLNAFMFFVDFPDAVDGGSPKALHDKMVPGATEWYEKASYGKLKLKVTADTSAYHRMPKPIAEYNWMGRNGNGWFIEPYIQDAIDAFTAKGTRSPPEVDVLYIVPTGRAANYMARSITRYEPISTRQGKKVTFKKTVTFGAADWDLNAKTMIHETGHTICLPDYYSFSSYAGLYVGGYSIMAQTEGIAPDFFAWDKYRLGWIQDKAVDCVLEAGSTTHVLTPLAVDGAGKKAVVIAGSETTALIAEVRIPAGVDEKVCAPGVILTTINTRMAAGNGLIKVVDATPGSLGCVGNLDDLNDAALSLTLKGSKSLAYAPVSSLDVPGWDVKVTLVSVKDQEYTIRVDRKTSARTDSW